MKDKTSGFLLKTIIVTSAVALFSTVTFFNASSAWFKDGVDIEFPGIGEDPQIVGGMEKSYFGGGKGTEDDPYIIFDKNHLYNLAWLQYRGNFNLLDVNDSSTGHIQELYFKITDDIDMSGITLPPIGTETYPFFGHLYGEKDDGTVPVLSNVTVSNDDPRKANSDFGVFKPTRLPDPAFYLNGNDSEHEHLTCADGFFGVIGKIPTNTTITKEYFAVLDEDGNPVLDEDDNQTYIDPVPSFENVVLENIKVNSKTDQVLIGLAAGYVDGFLNGIRVTGSESFINVNETATYLDEGISSQLSDYGLVGFSEQKGNGGEYAQKITEYYDSNLDNSGQDDEWGGSVNMKALYNRLDYMKRQAGYGQTGSRATTIPFQITDNYLDNEFDETVNTPNPQYTTHAGWSYSPTDTSMGNFVFSDVGAKNYLTGGRYVTREYYHSSNFYGHYITDGSNHYLAASTGTSVANTNSPTDKRETIWEFLEQDDGTFYIRNYNDDTDASCYLRNYAGSLRTTTTPSSDAKWQVIEETTQNLRIESVIGDITYRLIYNNGWTLVDVNASEPGPSTYAIMDSSETYYLPTTIIGNSSSNTNINGTTNNQLIFDELRQDQRVTFTYNNTTYYLCCYSTRRNQPYIVARTSAASGNYISVYYHSGTLRTGSTRNSLVNNQRMYISFDNSNRWVLSASTYSISTVEIPGDPVYPYVSTFLRNTLNDTLIRAPKVYDDTVLEGLRFRATDTTYLPLNVYEQATDGHARYTPTDKNTGYLIAGATGIRDYDSSANQWNYLRSVTVNEYPCDEKIPNSYSTSTTDGVETVTLDNIKTIKDDGIQDLDTNGLVKYSYSKSALENILKGGNVYGVHFTNTGHMGAIGMNSLLEVPTAYINGEPLSNYKMPVFSIDFNLKKRGVINFFAGAYNGRTTLGQGLDSFFSLHQIIRNDSGVITAIKELYCIYEDTADPTKDYVYSYKDSSGNEVDYSGDPFNSSGLTLKFNTEWIGAHDSTAANFDDFDVSQWGGYIFYFEIPVNKGEFCMGNVEGANEGCYLLYLDIASNGNAIKDLVYSYSVITRSSPALFPLGVDFDVDSITRKGGDTICISIASGKSGEVSFAIENVTDAPDEITILDSDGIAAYSYQSATFGETFIVSGNSPGDLPKTNPSVVQTFYIKVIPAVGAEYDVMIVDTFEEQVVEGEGGTSTVVLVPKGTKYYYNGSEVSYSSLATVAGAVVDNLDSIEDRDVVITLDRTSGIYMFEVSLDEMPWQEIDAQSHEVAYNITLDATNITIEVTINGSITVTINDTEVENGAEYP